MQEASMGYLLMEASLVDGLPPKAEDVLVLQLQAKIAVLVGEGG
jgi:hypothetical protein